MEKSKSIIKVWLQRPNFWVLGRGTTVVFWMGVAQVCFHIKDFNPTNLLRLFAMLATWKSPWNGENWEELLPAKKNRSVSRIASHTFTITGLCINGIWLLEEVRVDIFAARTASTNCWCAWTSQLVNKIRKEDGYRRSFAKLRSSHEISNIFDCILFKTKKSRIKWWYRASV